MQVTKIHFEEADERMLFPEQARTGSYARRRMRAMQLARWKVTRAAAIASPFCSRCGGPREHPGTEQTWCDRCRVLTGSYARFVTSNT